MLDRNLSAFDSDAKMISVFFFLHCTEYFVVETTILKEKKPKKAAILKIHLFAGTSAVRGRTGSEPSEAEVEAVCQQEH